MMNNKEFNRRVTGFTLVEMAIVLVIVGFLLGAFLVPLQAQRDIAFQLETVNILKNSRQALLGFAQTNGRLPCPATANAAGGAPNNTGVENPIGGGVCVNQVGFLPAATLGIQPTDDAGFVVDAWNNRIVYAVTQSNASADVTTPVAPDFTVNIPEDLTTAAIIEADGIDAVGISNLSPDLRVCSTSTGVTAVACSGAPETNYLTNEAVVVIYSLGATAAQGPGGDDESENPVPSVAGSTDTVFVSHGIRANDPNGEFDHLVVWLSPYVLYNEMIQAGQLH